MKAARLSTEERKFFSQVAQAIFCNPFSEERLAVDALLAGVVDVSRMTEQERLDLFMPRLSARLEKLERKGCDKIQSFSGEDRRAAEYAWLFFIFHRYVGLLDELIRNQVKAGEKPLPVPFARDALSDMVRRGFSSADATRFLALFYQLRRAFYFVEKGLIGRSPPMKELRLALWNNVFTYDIALYDRHLWNSMEDFSTLLLGETGTGKGTAAAAIGRSGCIPFDEKKNAFEESFTKTFLSINLSQFPETLIESELFGHRKGAFTGAVDNHSGIFSRGSPHGALFLDEIGEVSVPIQIKLLQVLQERTFSPVGSHETKRFQGRVIAATNKPLDKIREKGLFRDDFFYRLSSDVIVVPPLRERIAADASELDDLISLITDRIIGDSSPEVKAMIRETIDRDLTDDYPWPGNVRELEQAVRRILLAGSYKGAPALQVGGAQAELIRGIEGGTLSAKDLLRRYCAILYRRHGSYEEVARKTNLDRRTVKKYIHD